MFSFFRKKDSAPDTATATATTDPERDAVGTSTPSEPGAAGEPDGFDWSALTKPAPPPSAAAPDAAADAPVDPALTAELQPKIVAAISTVYDPEIPVNIYELGLIYDVAVAASGKVHVQMTLTSPACPSAQQLPSEVEWKVKAVEGVTDAKVEIVWDPPWSADKMSEAARLQLGML